MPSVDALHPVTAHAHDDLTRGLDLGLRTGFGDEWLRIGPAKIFLDGALSSETAALREPYATATPEGRAAGTASGYLQEDEQQLRRTILEAYRSGWSLAVHAIGDRAVDLAVAHLVEAQETFGRRRVPNRIEHAGMLHDEHLATLAAHGIAVTPQAAFAQNIGDAMHRSVGPHRRRLIYRARSFVDAGVMLAGSSDRPCADGTALRGIQAFVDRLTASGDIMGDAAERLTVEQALTAYTRTAAEAAGDAADKGTLTAGKLADMVVLADDPLTVDPATIHGIPVVATLAGGELTHTTL
jgi:predicted amidohydrolase YtcJ